MVGRQVVSLVLQLLLFVLFFHFFGLPLIHKYQQHQVKMLSSGQINADAEDDADAVGDGTQLQEEGLQHSPSSNHRLCETPEDRMEKPTPRGDRHEGYFEAPMRRQLYRHLPCGMHQGEDL